MVYVGKNVYKCTLYLCNVSKFKKCRKKGCNFYTNHRIKTLHGHIMQYDMDGKEINGYYISAGFVDDNLIYAKKEKLSDERGMDNE